MHIQKLRIINKILISKNFARLLKFIGVVAVFLISIRGFFGKLLAYGDLNPFSNDYLLSLSKFIYLWNTDSYGFFEFKGLYFLIRSFFEFISFNNALIAQNLFFIIFFLIAYCSFYYFLKSLKINPVVCYLFSFFYVFNPVTAAELSNGALGILIIYSVIPLLYLFLIKIIYDFSARIGIFFALVVTIILLNLQTAFWIMLGFLIFLPCLHFFYKKIKTNDLFRILTWFIVGVLLNFFSFEVLRATVENFGNVSYLSTFDHTYSQAYIHNLIRFTGNAGSSQPQLGYFEINIRNLLAFSFFGVIIAFFYYESKNLKTFLYSILIACSISLFASIIFMNAIRIGSLDHLISIKNLIIVSARNPQKLLYFFVFCYLLIFSISTNSIYTKVKEKRGIVFGILFLTIIVIIFGTQNQHFGGGKFGLDITRGDNNYFVEAKYENLSRILGNLDEEAQVAYLPFDRHIQQKLFWEDKILKNKFAGGQVGKFSNTLPVTNFYNGLCYDQLNLTKSLEILGINYVILDKNPISHQSHGLTDCTPELFYETPYVWGMYAYFDSAFSSFSTYYEDSDFKIIEINANPKANIYSLTKIENLIVENNTFPFDFINGNKYVSDFTINIDKNLPTNDTNVIFDDLKIEDIKIGVGISKIIKIDDIDFEKSDYILTKKGRGNSIKINNESPILESSAGGYSKYKTKLSKENVFTYRNDEFSFNNLFENNSFESGLWKNKVYDCDAFDDNPILNSKLSAVAVDGLASLQLEATNHVACTYQTLSIAKDKKYLFNFSYQSDNAAEAGYYIKFNDTEETYISERLVITDNTWHSFSKVINIPNDSTELSVYVYSYSQNQTENIITRYDNFHLIELPDDIYDYWISRNEKVEFSNPEIVTIIRSNPSKKVVKIQGASTPFYLVMRESYHPEWKMIINSVKPGKVNSFLPLIKKDQSINESHFEFKGYLNGWFIDIDKICKESSVCIQNSDNTYDFDLVIEFWPQRWFYLGLLISGGTLLGCVGYLAYDWQKRRKLITTKTDTHENN